MLNKNACLSMLVVVLLSACGGASDKNIPEEPALEEPEAPNLLSITNLRATDTASTSTRISWQTNVPSTGSIDYGTTMSALTTVNVIEQESVQHEVVLEGLRKNTTYYYRVNTASDDADDVSSEVLSFKTKPHDIDLSTAVLASTFGYDPLNATAALEAAIRSDDPVIVVDKQASDWIIDPIKVFDTTDKIIVVEKDVVIRARSGDFTEDNDILLNFVRPNNVKLYGYDATLAMNKEEYTTGEGRHAVALSSANGFTLEGFLIKDSGGDGLYIAGSLPPYENYSQNIYVDNVVFDNHRRQGMSIISAQDVWISNSTFKNTKGTAPEAGVDLEPNFSYQRLVNINFDECSFVNNNNYGFLLATTNLRSSSLPISVNVTNSYFSMNHDVSNPSVNAEVYLGADTEDPVTGDIVFDAVEFDGSEWGILSTRNQARSYQIDFKNITARNLMQHSNPSLDIGIITMEAADYSNYTTLGNMRFENVDISYNSEAPVVYIYDWHTVTEMKNITGQITVNNPSTPEFLVYRNGYIPTQTDVTLDVVYE